MKNKNVTKSLNLAFFAIAMCIGSSFLQGCSQDDESTAAVSGYTAEQKAEISFSVNPNT